jgi:hypothetical protein
MTPIKITKKISKSLPLYVSILCLLISCQFDRKLERSESFKYNDYVTLSKSWNDTLSEKGQELRRNALKNLKSTTTYHLLIDSTVVTPEYIPVFDMIAYGIKSKTIEPNGSNSFYFVDGDRTTLLKTTNGEDKMKFAINVVLLSYENKGGFTRELIKLFERYRKKYKFFGSASKSWNAEGELEYSIDKSYDFTPIFGLLDSQNDKILNAMQEARDKNISKFFFDANKTNYAHPFIATPEGYISHLSRFYKRSDYLPDDYSDSFWKNYDSAVRDRLSVFMLLKQCENLQKEFDIAYDNMDNQAKRTGSTTADLMDFIDDNMKRIGCYD